MFHRRLIYALLITTYLFNNTSYANELKSYAKKEWTFLLYYSGDNNLSDFMKEAIVQLKKTTAQTDNIHIVLQSDGDEPGDSKREYIKVSQAGTTETIVFQENIEYDMGREETLVDFLSWGIGKFPSKKIGVVINGHGRGIVNLASDDDSFKRNPEVLTMISSADDSSRSFFDEKVLARELKLVLNSRKIDLIVLASCLMGNYETLVELSSIAKYVTASEDLIYLKNINHFQTEEGNGVAIHKIASFIANNPQTNPEDIGNMLVSEYENSYSNYYYQAGNIGSTKDKMQYTLATYNLSKMATINGLYSTVLKEIATEHNQIYEELYKQFFSYPKIHILGYVDMGVVVSAIYNINRSETAKKLLQELYSSNFVISKTVINAETYISGVSIFMPYDFYVPALTSLTTALNEYKMLTWSKDVGHYNFISNYFEHIKENKVSILHSMINNLVNNGIREVTRFKSYEINDMHLFRAYEAATAVFNSDNRQEVFRKYFESIKDSTYNSKAFLMHKKYIISKI